MNEHTPGPWVVNGAGGSFERVATLEPAGVIVSAQTKPRRAQEIPNARLIAASPYLLEALIHAAEVLEEHGCDCSTPVFTDEASVCALCRAKDAIALVMK